MSSTSQDVKADKKQEFDVLRDVVQPRASSSRSAGHQASSIPMGKTQQDEMAAAGATSVTVLTPKDLKEDVALAQSRVGTRRAEVIDDDLEVQALADFLDQYDDMDALFSPGLEDAAAAPAEEVPKATTLSRGQAVQPMILSVPGAHAVGTRTMEAESRDEEDAAPDMVPVPPQEATMAQARPVHEEHIERADPVPEGEERPTRMGQSEEKRREILSSRILLMVAAVLAIVLAVALGISLGKSDNPGSSSTAAPTLAPTLAPSHLATILELPDYTLDAIFTDPESAQARAYDWLIRDPWLSNYTSANWKLVQRFALATIYYATDGDTWALNENWLDYDMDECVDWQFPAAAFTNELVNPDRNDTVCDESGQYTVFIRPANNLVGTLPMEISLLTKLQFLDLAANSMPNPIPTEIGLLTELKRISVDRNGHTGSIPTEFGRLTKLVQCYLGYNPYNAPLPTEFGLLGASLRKFNILRASVTGFLPSELYRLTNLEVGLFQNLKGIEGGTLEGIGALTKLQRFDAYEVPFKSTIPTEIGLLTDLSTLNLWFTEVSRMVLARKAPSIVPFFISHHLTLSLCVVLQLSGSIPSEFWQLTKMQRLDIDDNFLTGTFRTFALVFSLDYNFVAFSHLLLLANSGGTGPVYQFTNFVDQWE